MSHPEYADPDDGFGGLMTKDELTCVIQEKAFFDESYLGEL